ncbi:MAG: putative nucleotidyltransferase with HDIG domain [Verrucomicrobiales bacterium]|jgi:cyclic-di-AMP phosphodiesterase PgpH
MSAKLTISKRRKSRSKTTTNQRKRRGTRVPILTILLALLIWAGTLQILQVSRNVQYSDLAPGQRAPRTILAEVDFEVTDTSATELKRVSIAAAVRPVFSIDDAPLTQGLRVIDKILDRLSSTYQSLGSSPLTPEAMKPLADAIDLLELQISASNFVAAIPPTQVEPVREAFKKAAEATWTKGVISKVDQESRFAGRASKDEISLMRRNTVEESFTIVALSDLRIPAEATYQIVNEVTTETGNGSRLAIALSPLLSGWVSPNLRYEAERTDARRGEARSGVRPLFTQIRAGTPLVEVGKIVTVETIDHLRVHQARVSEVEKATDVILSMLHHSLLLIAMMFICGAVSYVVDPSLLQKASHTLLFGVLCMLSLILAKLLVYASAELQWISPAIVPYWLPYALPAMLATILIGSKFGLTVALFSCVSITLALEANFTVFLLGLLGSVTALITARKIHKRSNLFRAGLLIGTTQLLFTIVLAIYHQQTWATALLQGGTAFLNGPVIALITLMLIPLFEYSFKLTTDIRLLELSDMSHPVLERLALEAPGTYHHSLMVSNLASAAASEIGANDLLVRVCAYYHDIGKLTKPGFFIENIPYKDNPHDDLSPSMSTLVIIAHVKEGVGLAERYNLPQPIIDGIQQHHGTGVIAYFYRRAIELAEQEGRTKGATASEISDENFRYPGPKPQTLEMGILMLADAIEAASRSIGKASSSNIETLVNDISRRQLDDGQLDDCGITLTQLARVRTSFIFTLNNMLHGRIAYPKDDENRNKQSANELSARGTAAGDTRALAHAAGSKP